MSGSTSHDNVARFILYMLIGIIVVVAVFHISRGFHYILTVDGIETDNSSYAEMARVQLNGGQMYRDVWHSKPPLATRYTMLFVALWGNTLQATNIASATLDIFGGLAIAAAVYAITRSKLASAAGLLVALLYAVTSVKIETTMLMAAFGALAVAVTVIGRGRPAWCFAAGILFGIGLNGKQPLAVELPIFLAFTAFYAPPGRRLIAMAAGIAGITVMLGIVVVWLVTNGVFDAFWQQVFSSVGRYVFTSGGTWHFNEESAAVLESIWARETIPKFSPLVAWAGLAFYVRWRRGGDRRLLILVALWAIVSFVAAFMGRSMKAAYYIQIVPALVILITLALPVFRRWNTVAQIVLLIAALLTIQFYSHEYIKPIDLNTPYWDRVNQTALEYINSHTEAGDCLWMWASANELNYLSGRPACNSARFNGLMMDEWVYPIIPNRIQYMQELIQKIPRILVDEGEWGYFEALQTYADRYRTDLLLETGSFKIYAVDRSMWHPADANFGNEIRFIGYDLLPVDAPVDAPVCPGDTLTLAMTWQQMQTPAHQYQMFVQLLTEDETAQIAGYDGPPEDDRSRNATNTWVDTGEIRLGDRFSLTIPDDAAPGTYKLVVGLYDVEAPDQRVPVLDASGAQVGSYAILQELTIDACD